MILEVMRMSKKPYNPNEKINGWKANSMPRIVEYSTNVYIRPDQFVTYQESKLFLSERIARKYARTINSGSMNINPEKISTGGEWQQITFCQANVKPCFSLFGHPDIPVKGSIKKDYLMY
jgi:hypothetical protein